MISKHSKILFRELIKKAPAKSFLKRVMFKVYILLYLILDLILASEISSIILKKIRKIELKTMLKNNMIFFHKIEHIPYLYDFYYSNFHIKLKKNSVIIDVGAHIGTFSLRLANKSTIYCFEPNKENYSFLLKNIKINNFKKIFPYRAGVSNKNGLRRLFLSEGSGGHSFYLKSKKYEVVKVQCIDNFVKLNKINRVDLIKIDAEGEEINVLKGCQKTIGENSPIILLEIHPWYVSANLVIDYLEKIGYKIRWTDEMSFIAFKK